MRKFEVTVKADEAKEVEEYFISKGIDFHKFEGKSFDIKTKETQRIAMYIIKAKTKDIAKFNKNCIRMI